MAEVQVSTSSPAAVSGVAQLSSVDKDALITRLDTLLEQYLHTLDEYEKLMQQLSTQLSSGYFSLAQANFHNRSGTHYGQDSYDERVQATRKIIVTDDEKSRLRFTTASSSPSKTPKQEEADKPSASQTAQSKESEKIKEDIAAADEGRDTSDSDPRSSTAEADQNASTAKPTIVDPIRMFGILVPPELRLAQSSFREAVDGPVVRLAEVTGEMRALQNEIGRARKAIRKADA